jgi:hypothetical protein
MGEHSADFNVGDRVRTASGITGSIVEPPRHYDLAEGDSFTGWGAVVEEDTEPDLTLTRIERGLSPGAWHLVSLDRLERT